MIQPLTQRRVILEVSLNYLVPHLVEFWIFPRMVISQGSFPLFDHPQGEKKNVHSIPLSWLLP